MPGAALCAETSVVLNHTSSYHVPDTSNLDIHCATISLWRTPLQPVDVWSGYSLFPVLFACLERASVKHASPLEEQSDHPRVIPAQDKEGCHSCAADTQ